jgi:hypothetical protein
VEQTGWVVGTDELSPLAELLNEGVIAGIGPLQTIAGLLAAMLRGPP